jgi:ribosomal protein S13
MRSRRMAILGVAALGAVGGGAALAATQDDRGKQAEDAVLGDAADRLDVDTSDLRSALSDAESAQIDKAVENGDLTEEQAKEIKEHMQESGRVLGFPGGPGGPPGPGGPGMHGPIGPGVFDAIADELGISHHKLQSQLMSGKSMRKIANANGKTLADVKSVATAAIEKQLDEDVKAGRLTEKQADEIRGDLPQILQHLVRGPRFRGDHGPGGPGGPPPGAFGGPPPPPPPGAEMDDSEREFGR